MRYFALAATALLALTPAIAPAASHPWMPATATSVTAGITTRSSFAIQAYITLPMSCYASRVRTYGVTADLNRSFIVEQRAPATMCSGPAYKCTVSQTFKLPIQHKFDVHTAGKTWRVTLAAHAPSPMQPMCGS
jgi:hypothetical protein